MRPTRSERIALGLSGIAALTIGAAIPFAPRAFQAGDGMTPGEHASLVSALRAAGAGHAGVGLLMLFAIRRHGAPPIALAVARTVFIAFPAGRLGGVAVDGMPSGRVTGAVVVELVIAALCLAALFLTLTPSASRNDVRRCQARNHSLRNIMWTPFSPSTTCVIRRSPASDNSM